MMPATESILAFMRPADMNRASSASRNDSLMPNVRAMPDSVTLQAVMPQVRLTRAGSKRATEEDDSPLVTFQELYVCGQPHFPQIKRCMS
jgi:hypothetical protein